DGAHPFGVGAVRMSGGIRREFVG
ncbi:MAG: hypothetical protein QOG20_2391, partial [Pseudonocardiales bacterium]|nr:hypothetical protein [Pseudonocardiales bacterium]